MTGEEKNADGNGSDKTIQSSIEKSRLQRTESIIDIIAKMLRLLTWPLLILIIIIVFNSPISQTINLIPEMFEKSTEIEIANFLHLKVQEKAKSSGNEELASIIEGLSKEGIEWILKLGEGSYRVIGTDGGRTGEVTHYFISPNYPVWIELADRGLLESTQDLYKYKTFFDSLGPETGRISADSLTERQKADLLNNWVKLSDTGKKAYDIVLEVIADAIGE